MMEEAFNEFRKNGYNDPPNFNNGSEFMTKTSDNKGSAKKKYPLRKLGIALIILAVILAFVGVALMPTADDAFAAAMVAWIPGAILLWAGLVFTWWDGKLSDGGHMGS
ncbi:hypothetical protein ACFWDG_18410 [Peribacillus sp. NPDC060186]